MEQHMTTRDRTTGIALAFGAAVVSGISVFINSYGVRAVPDATVYTTAKNLVAAAVLVGVAALAGRTRDHTVREGRLRPGHIVGLAAVAVIGGGVAFVLFFEGLAQATSTQAAFIHKTLVVWVAVLAVAFLGERLRVLHVAAIAVLVIGQAVLAGGISGLRLGTGEWLVLAATLLWSVETVIAKRLLGSLPVRYVAITRMAAGAAVLVAWVALSGRWSSLAGLGGQGWLWAVVTGVILAGYVTLWYSALALAPAVDVTAVLVVAAVVTSLLNVIVKGTTITAWTLSGMLIVLVGVVLAANARPQAGLLAGRA
jgi:drug/metabolite transporter (DMT)-like permease